MANSEKASQQNTYEWESSAIFEDCHSPSTSTDWRNTGSRFVEHFPVRYQWGSHTYLSRPRWTILFPKCSRRVPDGAIRLHWPSGVTVLVLGLSVAFDASSRIAVSVLDSSAIKLSDSVTVFINRASLVSVSILIHCCWRFFYMSWPWIVECSLRCLPVQSKPVEFCLRGESSRQEGQLRASWEWCWILSHVPKGNLCWHLDPILTSRFQSSS